MSTRVFVLLSAFCVFLTAGSAAAQTAGSGAAQTVTSVVPAADDEGWRISIYPVLAWVPTGIDIDISLPPTDAEGGVIGQIIDSRFDGAFLGGFSAAKGGWRLDADGLWAAVGGDRAERPTFSVDADLIYLHVVGARRLVKDLFVTAGVRRLATKYTIDVDDVGSFERKPGVWDPLVGVSWHTVREHFEIHGLFEGGGFGVGSDVDLGASIRADWKPISHFGITAGFQILYFDISDTVLGREFRVKQTLHGPILGVGFYF
jgi:hypothetical protein